MHRQIISDFRGEERPISQVLDEYLAKTDELTTLTPEGRAFEGAFTLLRGEALLLDLKSVCRRSSSIPSRWPSPQLSNAISSVPWLSSAAASTTSWPSAAA